MMILIYFRTTHIAVYFISLLFVMSLASCTPREIGEETEVKTVIARYNNAIIEAYKNQSLEPLKQVAVEEQIGRVDTYVSAYLQADQIMEADIKGIDYKEIKIEGDNASVKTSEDWLYRWIDYKTGKEVEPLKDIHYEMLYHLIKKDGRWLVEKVEEKGSKAVGTSAY